jgi:hypothetical protein
MASSVTVAGCPTLTLPMSDSLNATVIVIVPASTISANAELEVDEDDELARLPAVVPVPPDAELDEDTLAATLDVVPADIESPGNEPDSDTIVPLLGAYSLVSASASFALRTFAFALSTDACAEATLDADDVAPVEVEPADDEPADDEPVGVPVPVGVVLVDGVVLGVVVVGVVRVVVVGVVGVGVVVVRVVGVGVVVVRVVGVGVVVVRVVVVRVVVADVVAADVVAADVVVVGMKDTNSVAPELVVSRPVLAEDVPASAVLS